MATRRKLTSIRLDKIAAVDKPCQEHATFAIIKRAPTAILKQTFQQALGNTLLNDQVRDAFYSAFDNIYEGKDAFRTALIDEFTAGGDGDVAADAFKAWLTGLVDRAVTTVRAAGAAQITPETLAKAFTDVAEDWLNQQEQTMHKFTTKAALQSAVAGFAIAKATAQDVVDIKESAIALGETGLLPAEGVLAITVTTADPELAVLKRRVDVAEMPANIRKHYDGLDKAGQDAFIAKDAAGRQADVDAIEKGDPIIYTCADGTAIRKSDGAFAARMAKRADEQDEVIKGLRAETTGASIEKRAAAYPNIAKAVSSEMLKSVDTVGADSEAGKAILKSLDTMNKGSKALFKSLGSTEETGASGEGSGDIQKARQSFEGKVTEIAKRDSIPRADAMSKARTEHEALFLEAYPAPVDADEA
jgi:hypothetical protein